MSRPIKFRVWDGTFMQYFPYTKFTRSMTHHPEPTEIVFQSADYNKMQDTKLSDKPPQALMQYTGLLDKNGKEIFEGDILNKGRSAYGYPIKGENVIVEWKNTKGYTGYGLTEIGTHRYEVIGNIHESPNLLNESRDE